MDDPFKTFIGDMLSAKAWNAQLNEDARKQLAEDLQVRLMDQIDQAVIESLPDDKVGGINELLDHEAGDDEVRRYIADSGVDIQRVTTETMLRFRDLYLGAVDTNE